MEDLTKQSQTNVIHHSKHAINVKVGDASIKCRNARECIQLAKEVVPRLAQANPMTVKSDAYTIKGGTLEQCSQATEITGRLADQAPVEGNFFGNSFKAGSVKKLIWALVIVTTCTGIGWKIKNYLSKKDKKPEPEKQPETERPESKWDWLVTFNETHSMPHLPPILQRLIDCTPNGYKIAMLFNLISAFAGFCFSKVRAVHITGKIISANIQVIIEGESGSGKGKFETAISKIFAPLISRDKVKINQINDNMPGRIIQYSSAAASESKLLDFLAGNQGIHMFLLQTEIITVIQAIKKGNGLRYEHLRQAFDNGEIARINRNTNAIQGIFNVYLNYVFTGTPEAIAEFLPKKEVEGGTANRIIFANIPTPGRYIPKLNFPEGNELDMIQRQIVEWNQKYCYTTNIDGSDAPAPETNIDFSYVNEALDDWIHVGQWEIYLNDKNKSRLQMRGRIAEIAAHCALVLHMMWGISDENEQNKRKYVVEATRYIADYCMESYLHKFPSAQVNQSPQADENISVNGSTAQSSASPAPKLDETFYRGIPSNTVAKMVEEYRQGGEKVGYGTIAKRFGYKDDKGKKKVERAIKDYMSDHNLE